MKEGSTKKGYRKEGNTKEGRKEGREEGMIYRKEELRL